MSIETQIEHLHKAINRLCDVLESKNVAVPAPVAQAPAPVVQAVPVATAPVVAAPLPVPEPVAAPSIPAAIPTPVASAPAMPAPPAFEAPAAAPAPTGAPFTDAKGLMAYALEKYKALGQEKGSLIQGVLTTIGYQNINDIKPEHYGAFFAGVEAIK